MASHLSRYINAWYDQWPSVMTISHSQRNTSPAAAETPALAPSHFSNSDFWKPAFFLSYWKNKPFPTSADSPHLSCPRILWTLHPHILSLQKEPATDPAFSCLQPDSIEALQASSQGLSQMMVKLQSDLGSVSTGPPCFAHALVVQHLHAKEKAQLGW